MRVLFLHQQPCVRALKYAVGLRAVRPERCVALIRLASTYWRVPCSE